MARGRRIHIPNAFVNVSLRCNHGDPLLADPQVKQLFLAVLDEVASVLGYEVVSYCLQDDGLQLTLFTPAAIDDHTLSTFMHRLDSTFGHRLNRRQRWGGVTWQGRYRAAGWLPVQRLWLLEFLLWYSVTAPSRQRNGSVPASAWPWGALYWLKRGTAGPLRTTLGRWLEAIYGAHGEENPVGAFVALTERSGRPDWMGRLRDLERRRLPWLDVSEERTVQSCLKELWERVQAMNLRSWKREIEQYCRLALPVLQQVG